MERTPQTRTSATRTPKFWYRLVLVAVCGLGLISTARAGEFGTRCQEDFDDDWQSRLRWTYEICGGFNAELDDTDTEDFYYSLGGSTCGFSTCDATPSAGGVDTVDLFYVATHGGVLPHEDTGVTEAALAMRAQDSLQYSSGWRYGNDDDQVGIFSQYACETLHNRDGNIWTRWDSVFRGGVYIVTGSHDSVWGGITTDEVGRDYADGLQKNKSVRSAWFDGNSDWWFDQDLKVMAVGTSAANCRNRRDGFTWQSFSSYSRLRDSNINYWCTVRITG